MNEITAALKDWIPFRLREEYGEAFCQWLYLGDKTFDEPFFDETIAYCRHFEVNSKPLKILSDLQALTEWASLLPPVSPTALIFHVSRCGSTLLSQLLATDPANIVLSEVPLFDELLRCNHHQPDNKPEWLKGAVTFLGTKRKKAQQHLFIKTDSWHIHFYDQWRQLYPDVPVILLYRRPDEVIRSHQQHRGMQAVQGVIEPSLFGFGQDIFYLPPDEYMARVMETFLAAFERVLCADKKVLAVNYNEGMLTAMNKIAAFTGISISDDVMEQMKTRAGYHAKHPQQVFKEPILDAAIPACQQRAFELYEQIERMRKPNDKL